MTAVTAFYWVKKRSDAQAPGSVVVGKRVVIDETGGVAHVQYILTVERGGRAEVVVPAETYERAGVGARVERRRDGVWIVTPR